MAMMTDGCCSVSNLVRKEKKAQTAASIYCPEKMDVMLAFGTKLVRARLASFMPKQLHLQTITYEIQEDGMLKYWLTRMPLKQRAKEQAPFRGWR